MKWLTIILVFCSAGALAQSFKDQFILCAHRGGMYDNYAENSLRTLEFLEKSFAGKEVMAEVDIRKSKDGTLFLLHDNTLERTTNGIGEIGDKTDAYLKSLKLKNGKGELTDEGIPTFRELLQFVSKRRILLMLDVKIDDWKVILDEVRAQKMISKCLVLTFKPEYSKKVHELAPDILVSCLVRDENDWDQIKKIVSKDVVLAYVSKTTPDVLIAHLKAQKIPLVSDASEATTNNFKLYTADYYRSVIDRGVNVYVTDLPIEVSKLISN
ncbi:MAG TPA: glycerophosphodiester phosphodiesterase family protein [Cyclobacteriaceae bacterium]|nr:glycerophosphodiester phosphodiesterase family protein [Cyclobacteriaceae bacterium]